MGSGSADKQSKSSKRRALVVDDEDSTRDLLRFHLGLAGLEVDERVDGFAAVDATKTTAYDLIALDVMLPGLDGLSVCRSIRADGLNTCAPVLIVTARKAEAEKVLGLDSGADDYVTKPFSIPELMARVRALLRRHARMPLTQRGRRIAAGGLWLDAGTRQVTVGGRPVALTRREFDVLFLLASNPWIVFSRTTLLKTAWAGDSRVTERAVDSLVSRLRQKVEADPRDPSVILTAWGVGYKVCVGE